MASSERDQMLTEVEMSAVFLVFNPLTYWTLAIFISYVIPKHSGVIRT